jgi:hypothetical protein
VATGELEREIATSFASQNGSSLLLKVMTSRTYRAMKPRRRDSQMNIDHSSDVCWSPIPVETPLHEG